MHYALRYPLDVMPVTWPYNEKILTRLDEAVETAAMWHSSDPKIDYSKLKYFKEKPVYWAMGDEIDFIIYYNSKEVDEGFLQEKREAIHSWLKRKIDDNAKDREACAAQIHEVMNYSLRDIMMFEINEYLGNVTHKKTSNGLHSKGYYDNRGCSEIQVLTGPPCDVIETHHRAHEVIMDVVDAYESELMQRYRIRAGLSVRFAGCHLNFSANEISDRAYADALRKQSKGDLNEFIRVALKDGKMRCLFSAEKKDDLEFMTHAFKGIMQTIEETLLYRDEALTCARPTYSIQKLGQSRACVIRPSKNRAEWRASSLPHANPLHIADMMLRVVKGAAYGLMHSEEELRSEGAPEFETIHAAHFTNPETEKNPFGKSFYIKRVLQCSRIDDLGFFHPDEDILEYYRKDLVKELFRLKGQDNEKVGPSALGAMFSRIRLEADGTFDFSEAKAYLNAGSVPGLNDGKIAFAEHALKRVAFVERFKTISYPGRKIYHGYPLRHRHIEQMKASKRLRYIYGDRWPERNMIEPLADCLAVEPMDAVMEMLPESLLEWKSDVDNLEPKEAGKYVWERVVATTSGLADELGVNLRDVMRQAYERLCIGMHACEEGERLRRYAASSVSVDPDTLRDQKQWASACANIDDVFLFKFAEDKAAEVQPVRVWRNKALRTRSVHVAS